MQQLSAIFRHILLQQVPSMHGFILSAADVPKAAAKAGLKFVTDCATDAAADSPVM